MNSSEQSIKDYLPILPMGGLIIMVQVLALFLSTPMEVSGMQAFEDPTQVSNVYLLYGINIGFHFICLDSNKEKYEMDYQFPHIFCHNKHSLLCILCPVHSPATSLRV